MGKVKAKSAKRKPQNQSLDLLSRRLKTSLTEVALENEHEYALGQIDLIRHILHATTIQTGRKFRLDLSVRIRTK